MVIKFGPEWDDAQEARLQLLLGKFTKLIILAGAGISASAGSGSTLSLL